MSIFINYGSFGRKVLISTSKGNSLSSQEIYVRRDFLLGLPTITSILRRISVVRSSNTKIFSEIFFSHFHQLWVIWEKSIKGELSVFFSFATRAFFREMVNSLFLLFPDFYVSFGRFWSSFNPSNNLLWLDLRWFAGLKWISNERIYQYHEHLAIITTFTPFIPPPHWFWKSVRYRPHLRVSQIVKF